MIPSCIKHIPLAGRVWGAVLRCLAGADLLSAGLVRLSSSPALEGEADGSAHLTSPPHDHWTRAHAGAFPCASVLVCTVGGRLHAHHIFSSGHRSHHTPDACVGVPAYQCALQDITNFIQQSLRDRDERVPPEDILQVSQRIKEQNCYVSQDIAAVWVFLRCPLALVMLPLCTVPRTPLWRPVFTRSDIGGAGGSLGGQWHGTWPWCRAALWSSVRVTVRCNAVA